MIREAPSRQGRSAAHSVAHLEPVDVPRARETPASLGARVAARTVDLVVFGWLVVFVVVELDQRLFGGDPLARRRVHVDAGSAHTITLVGLVVIGYEVVPQLLAGATLGKAMLGLRIRTVDTSVPSLLAAAGRAVVLYVPALALGPVGLLVPLLLASTIALATDRRGLHDRLLGTLVVALAVEESD
ncbi:MAG: RDD family protein [Acidimicrobiales bacterium]